MILFTTMRVRRMVLVLMWMQFVGMHSCFLRYLYELNERKQLVLAHQKIVPSPINNKLTVENVFRPTRCECYCKINPYFLHNSLGFNPSPKIHNNVISHRYLHLVEFLNHINLLHRHIFYVIQQQHRKILH